MFIYESEDIFGSDKNRKCLRCDPKLNINDPKSDLSHFLLQELFNHQIKLHSRVIVMEIRRVV